MGTTTPLLNAATLDRPHAPVPDPTWSYRPSLGLESSKLRVISKYPNRLRVTQGTRTLLSEAEIRRQNSTTGVNLVPWPMGIRVQDRHRRELTQEYLGAFIRETGAAFRIKEAIFQTPVPQDLQASLMSGAVLMGSENAQSELSFAELQSITANPHLMYLTKELAMARVGSWATSLFTYNEPQIGFTRSEQRLLDAALRRLTDDEVASELRDLSVCCQEDLALNLLTG